MTKEKVFKKKKMKCHLTLEAKRVLRKMAKQ